MGIKKLVTIVVLVAIVSLVPLQILSQIEPRIAYEEWCIHLNHLYNEVEETEDAIAAAREAPWSRTVQLQAKIDTLEEQRRKRNRNAWAVGIGILAGMSVLGSIAPEVPEGTPEYAIFGLVSGVLVFGGIGLWSIHRFEDRQILKQIDREEKALGLAYSVRRVAQLQLLSKLSDLREEIAKWERLGEPYFWFYPCE